VGTANKIRDYLERTPGIDAVFRLEEEDRLKLLDVETAAEKKAFMGLGMCYNSGIRDVLRCPLVFVCITNMNFEWGCQAHMVLKKDDVIVGEEVLEESRIEQLKGRKDVWFLHKNFVIYKERVDFPQDLVEKKCCFEIPALTWDKPLSDLHDVEDYRFSFPSTAGDIFLKERFYGALDERGTGTAVFGFNLPGSVPGRT
jgi:hypothetical protein